VSAGALESLQKQPTAAALRDGIDEQPILVDHTGREQAVAQRDAAGDHDVLARLLLERTDLLDGVTGEDRGVLLLGVGHGRGDDVLLHAVEVVADPCGVLGQLGPVAAQILDGPPPLLGSKASGRVGG
jgi:hypothetical protein